MRSRIVMMVVVLAALLGATQASTAGAATPACGATCLDLLSTTYGTHLQPAFELNVLNQVATVGQTVTLDRTSQSDAGGIS